MRLNIKPVILSIFSFLILGALPVAAEPADVPHFAEVYYNCDLYQVNSKARDTGTTKSLPNLYFDVTLQYSVITALPGDKDYTGGNWLVVAIIWLNPDEAETLCSEAQIDDYVIQNKIILEPTVTTVHAPIVRK